MSEQNTFVASDETVGRNRLNMSVPAFVKKKAQGARLVAPKLDQATRQSVSKDLSMLGANAN